MAKKVVGVFDSEKQFAGAVFELETSGIDRAQISIVAKEDMARRCVNAVGCDKASVKVEADEDAIILDDDSQQQRVLFTSLSATVAALLATGVTLASGGAAIPAVIAALAAGGAAGGVSELVSRHTDEERAERLREDINNGGVMLVVSLLDDSAETVIEILDRHGSRDTHSA